MTGLRLRVLTSLALVGCVPTAEPAPSKSARPRPSDTSPEVQKRVPHREVRLDAERVQPFAQFLSGVHHQIHRRWADSILTTLDAQAPSYALNDQRLGVELEMVVNPDGTLDEVRTLSFSSAPGFDAAALYAAVTATPFDEPPEAIRSYDGKAHFRWSFFRDERECSPYFAEPIILDPSHEADAKPHGPKITDPALRSLIDDYLVHEVRPKVNRFNAYPAGGRAEGRVILRFEIADNGELISAKVVSCPDALLCVTAFRAAAQGSPYPPPPVVRAGRPMSLDIHFVYKLE